MGEHGGAMLELGTLAGARARWMIARRATLLQRLEDIGEANTRAPVPGFRHKVIAIGGEVRDLDIRIDELTRLLRRTDEDVFTQLVGFESGARLREKRITTEGTEQKGRA